MKSIKQYWSLNLKETTPYKKFRSAFKGCGLQEFRNTEYPCLSFDDKEILARVESYFHQLQSARGKGQRCFLTRKEERRVLVSGLEQLFRQQCQASGKLAEADTDYTIDEDSLHTLLRPLVTNVIANDEKLKDLPTALHQFLVKSTLHQIFHWKGPINEDPMLKTATIPSDYQKEAAGRLNDEISAHLAAQEVVQSSISLRKTECGKISSLLGMIAAYREKRPLDYWQFKSVEDEEEHDSCTIREGLVILVELLIGDKSEWTKNLLIPDVESGKVNNIDTCDLPSLQIYFSTNLELLGLTLTKDLYDSEVEKLRKTLEQKEMQLQESERESSMRVENIFAKEAGYLLELDGDEEGVSEEEEDDGSVSDESHQADLSAH